MNTFSKLVIILSALTLFIAVVSSEKCKAQQQAEPDPPFQERERLIVKKTDFNPPAWIKGVKTKARPVPLSKRFVDDDDWLKGFTVLVSNASNKTITHIGIEMLFRPEGASSQLPAGWFLYYGPNPFHYKAQDGIAPSSVPSVLPGGQVEIKLTGSEFEDLTTFLKQAGFPGRVHVVEIRVNTIGFADGTAWSGRMLKRDSNSPGGWADIDIGSPIKLQQPQGSARNRTAVFFPIPIGFGFFAASEPWGLLKARKLEHKTSKPLTECGRALGILTRCDTSLPEECVYPDEEMGPNPTPVDALQFFQTSCRTVLN